MKNTLLLLVLFFAAALQPASACKCAEEASVKKEIKKSDAVFTGSVIAEETFTVRDTILGTNNVVTNSFKKVTVKLNTLYKGELRTETVEVITGLGGGDCGFNFEKGKEYVIYADFKTQFSPLGNSTEKYLSTHTCKRTRLSDKNEIREIQKLRKPIKR